MKSLMADDGFINAIATNSVVVGAAGNASAAISAANTAIETLTKWGYDNNTTYIDGSKIFTGTISADKLNINEIFSKTITFNGTITSTSDGIRVKTTLPGSDIQNTVEIPEYYKFQISSPHNNDKVIYVGYNSDGSGEVKYNEVFSVSAKGAVVITAPDLENAVLSVRYDEKILGESSISQSSLTKVTPNGVVSEGSPSGSSGWMSEYMFDGIKLIRTGLEEEVPYFECNMNRLKHDRTIVGNEIKTKSGTSLSAISHIGMIIQSTKLDTMEKVIALFGGIRWERLEGVFLLGASATYSAGTTGGEATHTLSVAEMPQHTHTQQGTFTSGTESADHAHYTSGTTSGGGVHEHGYTRTNITGTAIRLQAGSSGSYRLPTGADNVTTWGGGGHEHNWGAWSGGRNTAHSHDTTISGDTTSVGEGSAHNNMPPYKVVYIWERVE